MVVIVKEVDVGNISCIKRSNRHQRRATPTLHLLFPKIIKKFFVKSQNYPIDSVLFEIGKNYKNKSV